MHKIRLSNKTEFPLTTAPALILLGGRVLAQGLISYTPIGADYDLPVTQAVEINPAAVGWSRAPLVRANLSGHWLRKKRWNFWNWIAPRFVFSGLYLPEEEDMPADPREIAKQAHTPRARARTRARNVVYAATWFRL